MENGATEAELATERGCTITNIRQQYTKACNKLKILKACSRSINFEEIQRIPTDKREQENIEGK